MKLLHGAEQEMKKNQLTEGGLTRRHLESKKTQSTLSNLPLSHKILLSEIKILSVNTLCFYIYISSLFTKVAI